MDSEQEERTGTPINGTARHQQPFTQPTDGVKVRFPLYDGLAISWSHVFDPIPFLLTMTLSHIHKLVQAQSH